MRIPGRSFAFLCAVALGAACGGSSTTSPGSSTGTPTPTTTTAAVTMSGRQFNPATVTVSPGAVVTWTNQDNFAHNVTFSSSSVTSIDNFSTGSRSATMPQTPGTYTYRCTIHANMNGTVVVQ